LWVLLLLFLKSLCTLALSSSSSSSSSSLLTFALGIVGRLVIIIVIIIICELVCCRRCAVFATKTKRWIKALMMGSRRQKGSEGEGGSGRLFLDW
jgi:fumarate reductase subunit D